MLAAGAAGAGAAGAVVAAAAPSAIRAAAAGAAPGAAPRAAPVPATPVAVTFASPGANYPCHYEVPSKIFATNTYIYPDVSTGTKLYIRDKSYFAPIHAKTIKWNPNRSCCFIPQDNVTWHSYDNNLRKTRIVLLMGFVDEKRQTNFYDNPPEFL